MHTEDLLKDWLYLVRLLIWIVIFLTCNRIYCAVYSYVMTIVEDLSDANFGIIPRLLLMHNKPCAFLSSVLTIVVSVAYVISKRGATCFSFSFVIIPLASIATTLTFSMLILYATVAHTIPIIVDLYMPDICDVACFLVLSLVATFVAKAVRKW